MASRRRLTNAQKTALRQIVAAGGALDAKYWSSFTGRWEKPRASPPYAKKYWRVDTSFLPTETYPERVHEAFAANPSARAVIAIYDWNEASRALGEVSEDE